jgi:hypothetical protein
MLIPIFLRAFKGEHPFEHPNACNLNFQAAILGMVVFADAVGHVDEAAGAQTQR